MKHSFFKTTLAKIAIALKAVNAASNWMKYSSFAVILLLMAFVIACKKDRDGSSSGNFDRSSSAGLEDVRDIPNTIQVIPNVISTNTTLTSDKVWIINGPTYVTNNATLTIQPGTYIKGRLKANTPNNYPSFLMVTKGADLVANGTSDAPIVFTSEAAACNRAPGNWGGIVLLGSGRTNAGVREIEGIQSVYVTSLGLPFPSTIQYGDSNDSDNSGSLKYVRIEFAGDVIAEGNELNGLTLGGVGYNTYLENIQVSYGADDAFEFFGGAVNAKYLVSYGNNDDDFDFDQGYQGSIQFAVGAKVPCLGYSPNPNGIESNNITSPVVVTDPTRLTRPVLANFTILGEDNANGPTGGTGTLFRVNSGYAVRNFVVGGFNTGSNVSGGTPAGGAVGNYSYSLIHGFTTPTVGIHGGNVTTYTGGTANGSLRLVSPFNVGTCICPIVGTKPIPDFRYKVGFGGSAAATAGEPTLSITVTHPGGALPTSGSFVSTVYAGAFPASTVARWDDNWATYTPQTNPYL